MWYITIMILKLPVYTQKFLTLLNDDEAPMKKANKSVTVVIVIPTPLERMVAQIRVSGLCSFLLLYVSAKPERRRNISSNPIPTVII